MNISDAILKKQIMNTKCFMGLYWNPNWNSKTIQRFAKKIAKFDFANDGNKILVDPGKYRIVSIDWKGENFKC